MNTPSNKVKAQFFALYWKQEVLKYEDSEDYPFWDKHIYPVDVHNITCKGLQLNLRLIDKLTDEELIEVAILYYGYTDRDEMRKDKTAINIFRTQILLYSGNSIVGDYLRSIGILLSFTYLSEDNKPITLSPSDLIGLG